MTAQVVIKKDGREEPFAIEKIRKKIEKAHRGTGVNPLELESKLSFPKQRYTSKEIQNILIQTSKQEISVDRPEFNLITGRLSMDNLYREVWKNTHIDVNKWEECIEYLCRNGYYRKDISTFLKKLSKNDRQKVTKLIENKNFDFELVYSQVEVLKTKYLIKNKKGFIEYPVISDIANALILSGGGKHFWKMFYFIHHQFISLATPFKRNLRRPDGNTGSCFIGETGDNLASIFKSYTDMAFISKNGGGIGWYLGKIRPGGTYTYNITESNLITKWMKIINDIVVAVNQSGTRKGAITVALDWWHLDIFEFLSIKSELEGDLRDKAFDIFPQVVVDKYFIEKVKNKEDVWLFNHYEYQKATGKDITELVDDELYKALEEAQHLAEKGWISGKKIKANKLWKKILWIWVEIGDFYIANKNGLNKCNYLKYNPDYGVTKCGNLCVESFSLSKLPTKWIEEYNGTTRVTTETNGLYHSCNLISINAEKLIKHEDKIQEICFYAVLMLDKSINEGTMPVLEAKKSAQLLRNIGVGVVGLADYLAYNKVTYNSDEGALLGEKIVEKIAYHCYEASVKLAEEYGPYPAFQDANYEKFLGYTPEELDKMSPNNFKWSELVEKIRSKGIRNFLVMAIAPNTTSGIMMGVTASYLPVYNKEMSQTLSDMVVTILPPYIKERYWYYKTKFQYNPKDIIKFTRRIQKWIDTGISMEININPDITNIKEISDAIIEGFDSGELKAVYYSLTIGKDNNNSCTDCSN